MRQTKTLVQAPSLWDPADMPTTFHLARSHHFCSVEEAPEMNRGKVAPSSHPLYKFMFNAVTRRDEPCWTRRACQPGGGEVRQQPEKMTQDAVAVFSRISTWTRPSPCTCLAKWTSSLLHFSMLIYRIGKKEPESVLHYSLSVEYILAFF